METCEPRHVRERARKGGRACACESIHADKIDKKGKFGTWNLEFHFVAKDM